MVIFEKQGTSEGFFEFPATSFIPHPDSEELVFGLIQLPFRINAQGQIRVNPKMLKHYYENVLSDEQRTDLEEYLEATGGKLEGQIKVL